jgi:mRNA interferase MazF
VLRTIFTTKFLQMNLQRGDVVLCHVPMPSKQLQEFKLRPAVVVSATWLNIVLDDVMVVPCTSNTRRSLSVTQYLITGNEIATAGIRVESIIRCESIFTPSKLMILRKLGTLDTGALEQVNACLRAALQL